MPDAVPPHAVTFAVVAASWVVTMIVACVLYTRSGRDE